MYVPCVTSLFLVPQAQITMKVIQGLYSGVTTVELDTLAAETAATLTTKHPDYALLAARIAVSNLHKETKKVFSGESEVLNCHILYDFGGGGLYLTAGMNQTG